MQVLKHIIYFAALLALVPWLTAKVFFYFSASVDYGKLLDTAQSVFIISSILYYLASVKISRPQNDTLFIIYLIGFYLLLYSGTLMII